MAPPPLRFITFEGGEGGGKSTQLRALAEALRRAGADVVTTREPGGAPGAEEIRRLLVEGEPGRWAPEAEALLHFAARAEHLAKVIRPALDAGQWVLSDRFADSTLAYQGYGQGVDLAWLNVLRHRVVGATEPGLTLVLDVPVETGLGRAQAQQRYERMGAAFHARLRDGFLAIARDEPERCVIIDAARPIDAVAAEAKAVVAKRFGVKL
ncbi:MAG TPA: dTMP kinase [Dongiaceae bacterium]|jgi:dTMP kinase|nr:dTMP kinase [Dongiaceae bacterium]